MINRTCKCTKIEIVNKSKIYYFMIEFCMYSVNIIDDGADQQK